MKRPKVYVETTVVSYLTSRPSNNIIVLARQRITEQWWKRALQRFNLYVSQAVIEEAQDGDKAAAQKRLKAMDKFPLLDINEDVARLYDIYLAKLKFPRTAFRDALHLAVSSIHAVDYVVTWNCAHIANGEVIKRIIEVNTHHGISIPVIVTPDELMEDS